MGRCVSILVRIITVLLFAIALLLGWLSRFELPEAVFFATLIPLLQGQAPPSIVGHGKMTGVPPVPDDFLQPLPRPEREMFLLLPKKKSGSTDSGNDNNDNNEDNYYYKMPQNGLGMCCRPTAYDDEMVRRTVLWYLLQGGRLIDTAHLYLNHAAIGVALQQAMQQYGVPRDEIFVTTKIFPGTRQFGNATAAYNAVAQFCKELQVDYIDLLLIHMPSNMFRPPWLPVFGKEDNCKGLSTKQCRVETWKGLSLARDDGLVRSLGVSNFDAEQIAHLANLDLAPVAVHQMAYNPWAPDWAVETFEYCQKHGIAVTAYSSLGGLFSKSAAETAETITSIAKIHDKSAAQVMLRWALQKNAAVIPGTGNPKHMRENLEAYNFELSADEMNRIDALRQDESARKFFFMKLPSDSE